MSYVNPHRKLCFNEVYDGASARMVKLNGKDYLPILDLIKIPCKVDGKIAAQKWRRDISDERKMDLSGYTEKVQFSGTFHVYICLYFQFFLNYRIYIFSYMSNIF